MQRTAIFGTLALLGILLATPLGSASHCNGIVTPIMGGAMYLDDRSQASANADVFIYIETNGQAGLQSGGFAMTSGSPYPWIMYDPCDHPNPDQLVYSPYIIF